MTFDKEKFNEILRTQAETAIPMRLPGAGVMFLQSGIRLLCLHPDYKDFGEDMKAYVQTVRDWCLLSMRRMGLDEEVIEYLDGDREEVDPLMVERSEVALSRSVNESYTIQVLPVFLTIIHGALVVMLAHPDVEFSPEGRQLVAEIRAACIRMYQMFGFSQEEADFLDTH